MHFGRDVALDDADVLDKVNGQRILGDIALLELVEQALQQRPLLASKPISSSLM